MGKQAMAVIGPQELTVEEQERRDRLEGIISRNMAGFVAVGLALREIKERGLHRSTHPTFEAYVQDRFELERSYAHRIYEGAITHALIAGSDFDPVQAESDLQNVAHGQHFESQGVANWQHILPVNERQVRPLTRLPLEERAGAWFEAVKTAPNGKITASHVADTVKRIKGETVKQTTAKIRENLAKDELFSSAFKGAFDAFLHEIEKAKEGGFQETSKEAIVRHLDALKKVLAAD